MPLQAETRQECWQISSLVPKEVNGAQTYTDAETLLVTALSLLAYCGHILEAQLLLGQQRTREKNHRVTQPYGNAQIARTRLRCAFFQQVNLQSFFHQFCVLPPTSPAKWLLIARENPFTPTTIFIQSETRDQRSTSQRLLTSGHVLTMCIALANRPQLPAWNWLFCHWSGGGGGKPTIGFRSDAFQTTERKPPVGLPHNPTVHSAYIQNDTIAKKRSLRFVEMRLAKKPWQAGSQPFWDFERKSWFQERPDSVLSMQLVHWPCWERWRMCTELYERPNSKQKSRRIQNLREDRFQTGRTGMC